MGNEPLSMVSRRFHPLFIMKNSLKKSLFASKGVATRLKKFREVS